jgi:uncharacterized membrane protein YfcA
VDAATLVGALVVGFAAGVLSGMFGVGGAVITTPGIRALGASPIYAVGSTIPAILPGAITGTFRYTRAGLVDWRIGLVCGISGSVLAIGGAKVSDVVDARWLMVLTAAILAWSGVVIIRRSRARIAVVADTGGGSSGPASSEDVASADEAGPTEEHAISSLAGIGALSGFVAGLLGVGGGVIMMPLFTTVLRIPARIAVASSLVAVAIFSIPAMITHTLLGHIDWEFALPLLVGTVPGAWLGSRLTIGSSEQRVELLLGVFFIVVAFLFGGGELYDIVS